MITGYKIPFTGTNNVKLNRLLNIITKWGADEIEKVNDEWQMRWDESKPITVDLIRSQLDSIEIEPNMHKGFCYPPCYDFHLRRIAYFVKNPSEIHSVWVNEDKRWKDKEYFKPESKPKLFINDGYHRLMAALVLDFDEINVKFYGSSEAEKYLLEQSD